MAYRIALLVNGVRVSKYVRDLIEWAEEREDVSVCALIIHRPERSPEKGLINAAKKRGIYRAISQLVFAKLTKLERKVWLRGARYADHRRSFDVGERVSTHLHLAPIVSKSGYIYRFSDAQIEQVRALNADSLIRCGSGIFKGES